MEGFELISLAVVFRHGCRNPKPELKQGCVANLFTGNPMELTEKGESQIENLGSRISALYPDLTSRCQNVRLYCSCSQRSVVSGLSFLRGLRVRQRPLILNFGSSVVDSIETDSEICPVSIEGRGTEDTIFHRCKFEPILQQQRKKWKREVLKSLISEYRSELEALTLKLYRTMGLQQLSPLLPLEQRVAALKHVESLASTAEIEQQVLCGDTVLNLSDGQLQLLHQVSDRLSASKFPATEEGRLWASYATSELRQILDCQAEKVRESRRNQILIFSGHETTMAALCTNLLESYRPPRYGAAMVFEFWAGSSEIKYRIRYWSRPSEVGVVDPVSLNPNPRDLRANLYNSSCPS